MKKEIWKKIPGYQNYEVSDLGNVRSLTRVVERTGLRGNITIHGRKMSPQEHHKGYLCLQLSNGSEKRKTYKVHQLVAMAFLNHKPDGMNVLIDHIDDNKKNNRVENLQITDNRNNTSKGKKKFKKTSQYTGVSFNKGKWQAFIQVDKKNIYLGRFENEYDAHIAYQNELKKINNKK